MKYPTFGFLLEAPYHGKEKLFQTRNYSTSVFQKPVSYMFDFASFSLMEKSKFCIKDWWPVTFLTNFQRNRVTAILFLCLCEEVTKPNQTISISLGFAWQKQINVKLRVTVGIV